MASARARGGGSAQLLARVACRVFTGLSSNHTLDQVSPRIIQGCVSFWILLDSVGLPRIICMIRGETFLDSARLSSGSGLPSNHTGMCLLSGFFWILRGSLLDQVSSRIIRHPFCGGDPPLFLFRCLRHLLISKLEALRHCCEEIIEVSGFGFRVSGFGFRVPGLGYRVHLLMSLQRTRPSATVVKRSSGPIGSMPSRCASPCSA